MPKLVPPSTLRCNSVSKRCELGEPDYLCHGIDKSRRRRSENADGTRPCSALSRVIQPMAIGWGIGACIRVRSMDSSSGDQVRIDDDEISRRAVMALSAVGARAASILSSGDRRLDRGPVRQAQWRRSPPSSLREPWYRMRSFMPDQSVRRCCRSPSCSAGS